MKATISHAALAMASMLACLGTAQAEDIKFSEFEARLAKIESQLAAQDGVQQTAYYSDACDGCGCDDGCCGGCGGCCDCCSACGCSGGGYYAQVDMVFARAHVLEGTFGKLAEEYELAPRFILGYENCCGQGVRARYWHYGHHLDTIGAAGGARFEWDVFDLELTNRFQFARTDVTLAGGVRAAENSISSGGGTDTEDLIGLTMAADVETLLCCGCSNYWSAIYGSRLAILGGDWDGVSGLTRDDNVVVTELYFGVEYGCCRCGYDLYSQLKFEIQNWHSDDLANIGYSVGFVGPSWTIGVGF